MRIKKYNDFILEKVNDDITKMEALLTLMKDATKSTHMKGNLLIAINKYLDVIIFSKIDYYDMFKFCYYSKKLNLHVNYIFDDFNIKQIKDLYDKYPDIFIDIIKYTKEDYAIKLSEAYYSKNSNNKKDIKAVYLELKKHDKVNYNIDIDTHIGNYDCSDEGLKSLLELGIPKFIKGDFSCSKNQLTSLEGAPTKVEGDFSCSKNQLTSLEGAPTKVGGKFYCSQNQLTSLKGAPKTVGRDFDCSNNPNLTSLEGAPTKVGEGVGGYFDCSSNNLTSLEGAPTKVDGNFQCSNNPNLTSLKGAPTKVEGDFNCSNNPNLTSLKGAPTYVGVDFHYRKCPKLPRLEIERYYKTGAVKGEFIYR